MSKIFDEGDSDEELKFKTDNEYAKRYNDWRKKEELNKLKTKYGDDAIDFDGDTSCSSDDDEDGVELTEKVEKDFFKTLSCLKNKDPRIYDESVKFFDDKVEGEVKKEKKKKDQPVYIKDYERKLILEKGGQLSDEDGEEDTRARSPTYVEEQNKLKENLKNALKDINEDDDDWGGMFKQREKSKEDKEKEESDYKNWLAGQKSKIDNKDFEKELKPLKDYWNDPNLDAGEKFLRDYILNKKFLDNDNEDYIPTYDEIIHDSDENFSNDEQTIEKQEEFEHKYNFRFEEPDQEFIKRYPRTMENSVRKTDDRRKIKRAEVKERKQKEKEEKMQDLKKLQEFKRKEIEEKIEKLKEITGNSDLGFQDDDIDGDFDPDAHDKRMQALFNDEFYQGPEDEQKPEFPDLDEELEIENWERYNGEDQDKEVEEDSLQPHCEDEDFNMDCDYDSKAATRKELIENSKGKKKRKKKSKFAEAVSKPKPKFDPNDETYEKYLDEYYKFDCEDIIGDIPCRFKYRKVVPNSFGLSAEEILFAKERELNRWCSLKKTVQYRPDNVEKYEQIAYEKKGRNLQLKKKLLPSLFDEEEVGNSSTAAMNHVNSIQQNDVDKEKNVTKRKRKNKSKVVDSNPENEQINEDNKNTEGEVPIEENCGNNGVTIAISDDSQTKTKKKKKKNKGNNSNTETDNNKLKDSKQKTRKRKMSDTNNGVPNKKFKNKKEKSTPSVGLSDARLSAYGINPKKFKNKLKYGSQKEK